MKDVRILPDVLEDIAEAAAWYDENGYPGLGDRFVEAFRSYLPHLRDHGEIHRFVYSEFRKILLKPFPYKLFYRLHEDEWIVTLVIHAARDPRETRARLKERGRRMPEDPD